MFDLISGGPRHPFHDHSTAPVFVVSAVGHAVLAAVVVVVPLMYATDKLPVVPTIMAFVAAEPAPPPPPPPPKPPAARDQKADVKRESEPPASRAAALLAAPIEAPSGFLAEGDDESEFSGEGGVEGGIVGGVSGGIVGGLLDAPPPPPPPPPPVPVAPPHPVRIGGLIQAPALLKRVEPVYPEIAMMAKVGGMVILEAVVNADGKVESVKVLRSVKFLDEAAVAAVRQWEYSPLMLNGVKTPFVLSVMLSFRTVDR
jgi:protein TonB